MVFVELQKLTYNTGYGLSRITEADLHEWNCRMLTYLT